MQSRSLKWLTTIFLSLGLLAFAAGCEEGPAERGGERLDEAMDDIRDAAEDAADEIEDAAEDAKDEVDQRF